MQRRGALPETPQFVIYFIFNQFRKLLLWPTFSWFSTCVSRDGIRLQAKPQLKNVSPDIFLGRGYVPRHTEPYTLARPQKVGDTERHMGIYLSVDLMLPVLTSKILRDDKNGLFVLSNNKSIAIAMIVHTFISSTWEVGQADL